MFGRVLVPLTIQSMYEFITELIPSQIESASIDRDTPETMTNYPVAAFLAGNKVWSSHDKSAAAL